MTAFEAFTVITGIASIAGLIYAVYYGVQSKRTKVLAYQTTNAVPLATALSPEEDYKLTVLFRRPGNPDELVNSAHVRFLRFANFGKEPIRGDDIAPANPLTVVVDGVRVLDLTLTGASRPEIRLKLVEVKLGEHRSEAKVTFDFLDHQDGGVIKVLTVQDTGAIAMPGVIIGMPRGVIRTDQVRRLSWLSKVGWTLGGLIQISAIVATGFVFRWVTGSWSNWWLLALPLVAFIVPGLIIAIVAGTVWPSGEPRLPATLGLPQWFTNLTTNVQSYRSATSTETISITKSKVDAPPETD